MNKMIDWRAELGAKAELHEQAWTRLRELLALLEAIEAGDLLAELPEALDARSRHAMGVCLLAIMHRELTALIGLLEALQPAD